MIMWESTQAAVATTVMRAWALKIRLSFCNPHPVQATGTRNNYQCLQNTTLCHVFIAETGVWHKTIASLMSSE